MKFNIVYLALCFLGCSVQPSSAEIFKMNVSDFESINLKIPADVVWVGSESPSCVIECSIEAEKKIEVIVEGKSLIIKSRGNNWRFWDNWDDKNGKITIKISSLRLSKASINGSGDLVMKSVNNSPNFEYQINGSGDLKANVSAGKCRGSINGSGDVQIEGKANTYDLEINGSGDVKAFNFECKEVDIQIAGSGDAQVNATEVLKISIAGSGDVSYKGDPKKVNQKIAGSGEIRKS